MRLQQRNEHEHTFIIHHSDDLIEISLALSDGRGFVINGDGVECTFINSELEDVTSRIQVRKVSAVTDFKAQRHILWLFVFHLFDDLVLVIDTFDAQVLHIEVG